MSNYSDLEKKKHKLNFLSFQNLPANSLQSSNSKKQINQGRDDFNRGTYEYIEESSYINNNKENNPRPNIMNNPINFMNNMSNLNNNNFKFLQNNPIADNVGYNYDLNLQMNNLSNFNNSNNNSENRSSNNDVSGSDKFSVNNSISQVNRFKADNIFANNLFTDNPLKNPNLTGKSISPNQSNENLSNSFYFNKFMINRDNTSNFNNLNNTGLNMKNDITQNLDYYNGISNNNFSNQNANIILNKIGSQKNLNLSNLSSMNNFNNVGNNYKVDSMGMGFNNNLMNQNISNIDHANKSMGSFNIANFNLNKFNNMNQNSTVNNYNLNNNANNLNNYELKENSTNSSKIFNNNDIVYNNSKANFNDKKKPIMGKNNLGYGGHNPNQNFNYIQLKNSVLNNKANNRKNTPVNSRSTDNMIKNIKKGMFSYPKANKTRNVIKENLNSNKNKIYEGYNLSGHGTNNSKDGYQSKMTRNNPTNPNNNSRSYSNNNNSSNNNVYTDYQKTNQQNNNNFDIHQGIDKNPSVEKFKMGNFAMNSPNIMNNMNFKNENAVSIRSYSELKGNNSFINNGNSPYLKNDSSLLIGNMNNSMINIGPNFNNKLEDKLNTSSISNNNNKFDLSRFKIGGVSKTNTSMNATPLNQNNQIFAQNLNNNISSNTYNNYDVMDESTNIIVPDTKNLNKPAINFGVDGILSNFAILNNKNEKTNFNKNPMNPQNHFNTFSINKNDSNSSLYAPKPEMNIYSSSFLPKNINMSAPNISSNTGMSQMNNSNISKFKNRKNHEKENRRMAIELVKIKLKNDDSKNKDIVAKFKDLNIDPILIDSRGFNFKSNASMGTLTNLNANLASYFPNPITSNSFIIKNNTSEVLNQLGGPVEIKNNNFEINNNFYGSINIESGVQNKIQDQNTNLTNPSNNRSNSTINYSLDENTQEKINWLCYLATPRILYMLIDSSQLIPFIFKLLPSKLCHSHMIEHYVLQWSDIQSLNPLGSVDLLKINHCYKKGENRFIINAEINTEGVPRSANINYEIITQSIEDCENYVSSLNHVSQLVKCKIFAYKNHDKK